MDDWNNGQRSRAISQFRKLAEAGDVDAAIGLGRIALSGAPEAHGPAEALRWFNFAATQNDPRGYYDLGVMYRHDKGVDNDDARAAMHFQHAADLNYPPGLHNLGILYMTGTGVPQDVVRGVNSIVAAADAGYDHALYHMADLLFYGTGVQASEALALEYMEKAAEAKHPDALFFMSVLAIVEEDRPAYLHWAPYGLLAGSTQMNVLMRRFMDVEVPAYEDPVTLMYIRYFAAT